MASEIKTSIFGEGIIISLPLRDVLKGKIVIALSAANSCSLTGYTLAPHESLPIHMKWPVRLALTVACRSFLRIIN